MFNYWEYIAAFIAMFLTDFFYAFYIDAVREKKALAASNWAVVVYLIASFLVISYTTNHWLLIPILAGAWSGTYAAVVWRGKK